MEIPFNLYQHRFTTDLMKSFVRNGDLRLLRFLSQSEGDPMCYAIRRLLTEISMSRAEGYRTHPLIYEYDLNPGMCAYIFLARRDNSIWLHVEFGYLLETDLNNRDMNLRKFINMRENNPVLIQGKFIELKTFLVESISSYLNDRKVYVSEFNIIDYPFWFMQYYIEFILEASKNCQYHHYIPRFILRYFAVDNGRKRINIYSFPRTQVARPLHVEANLSKSYGVPNMYRNNLNMTDIMHIETQLSRLEGSCSNMVRKIISNEAGTGKYALSRKEVAKLQKFLFVMWYRNDKSRSVYRNFDFDLLDWIEVSDFIRREGISETTVWLNNIAQILDTDHESIAANNHILPSTKANYMHTLSSTLCIWEACNGDEFILTDGCFGCSIKDPGSNVYYNVFPIHPRVALVTYGNPENIASPCSIIHGSLVPTPTTSPTSPQQMIYEKVTVPRNVVNIVNGNILHRCLYSITYMRESCLMRYVRYYDVMKSKFFSDPQDFTWLKQDLFCRLNRTHP